MVPHFETTRVRPILNKISYLTIHNLYITKSFTNYVLLSKQYIICERLSGDYTGLFSEPDNNRLSIILLKYLYDLLIK